MKWLLSTMLVLAAVASFAGSPTGGTGKPGTKCDKTAACAAGLSCVQSSNDATTCELVCDAKRACPEDQRCVKSGAQSICRPIHDGLGL